MPARAPLRCDPGAAAHARALPRACCPLGDEWAYEVKWDGIRIVARVAGGEARLWSRRGIDRSVKDAEIATALATALGGRDAVVDGELCALDDDGRASFSLLQQGHGTRVLYAFDLLELDGESLCDRPLSRAARAALRGARPRATRCTSRAGSTTAQDCSSSRARTASRASSRSAARASTRPTSAPARGSRSRSRTRRRSRSWGSRAVRDGARTPWERSCWPSAARTGSSGPATSARG